MVGSSSPATIRRVVVLPQPEAPSRAKNEPWGTVRSRSSTAVKAPNVLRHADQVEVAPLSAWSPCVGQLYQATGSLRTSPVLRRSSASVRALKPWSCRGVAASGKISGLSARSGSIFCHRVLGALDGADVVDVGGQLGRDLRVVVVVDELLGVAPCGSPSTGSACCPTTASGPTPGVTNLMSSFSALSWIDVAGPGDAGREVALVQVLLVVVAGELADLPGVDGLLQLVHARRRTRRR